MVSLPAIQAKGWPLFCRPQPPLVFRTRLGGRFEVTGNTRAFNEMLRVYVLAELGRAR